MMNKNNKQWQNFMLITFVIVIGVGLGSSYYYESLAAYAVNRFNPDTGTGFISKGELQSALRLTDSEFQEAINQGQLMINAIAFVEFTVECIEPEPPVHATAQEIARLTAEVIKNNQGRATGGIELTGYVDSSDPFELEQHPGSFCNELGETGEFEYTSFEVRLIEVQLQGQPTRLLPVR